ncbi:MAG: LarC family nickel insertion protein, partial [Fischerella sp.]|nr:LarC family nickel insertion protein [Fischerella sp.]
MRILYYDCFAGISGDMNLGALMDLGVKEDFVVNELSKLRIDIPKLKIQDSSRKGVRGKKVEINLKDTKYIFKKNHDHGRTFKEIRKIIEESALDKKTKEISLNIFSILAQAESKIHNCLIDDVHFHEIGAIDSIVDIVGGAICLEYLKVDEVWSSSVVVGGGYVKCSHGILPVPVSYTH